MIGPRYWLRRAWITSSRSSARCKLVSSPCRFRCRYSARIDERVSGALRDCSPVAILTTSAVVGDVMPYAGAQPGGSAPAVIEIDALDLDSPRRLDANVGPHPKTAYLQYTSGSTRQPAGVVVSHRNVIANVGQIFSDYMEHRGKVPPPDTTFVSWLPFYHDMGLIQGVFAPLLSRGCGRDARRVLMSPDGVPAEAGSVDAVAGDQ